jgi:hypothetical protein
LRLPPEILERVMLLLRDDTAASLSEATAAHEDAIQLRLRPDVLNERRPTTHFSWLTLSHTCRRLRDIALGCGQLWTVVDAELGTDVARLAASRVGDAPLKIRLQLWRASASGELLQRRVAFVRDVLEFFTTGDPLLGRASELTVTGISQAHLSNMVQALARPMPHLETLIVRSDSSMPEYALPSALLSRKQPLLTRVELRGFHQALGAFPALCNLRTLVLETVDFPAQAHSNPTLSRATPTDICEWLERMPLLEKIGLHGIIHLGSSSRTPRVVALPHLAELAITARANTILALLSGLPVPRRVLALTGSCRAQMDETGALLDVEAAATSSLLRHALAFYSAAADDHAHHVPILDLKPDDGSMGLHLSSTSQTLSIFLSGLRSAAQTLDLVSAQLLPLRTISRFGIARHAALTYARTYLPEFCAELVIDISDSYFTGTTEDALPANDMLVSSIGVLRIIYAKEAVAEADQLECWLEHRNRAGLPPIRSAILQGCFGYKPSPDGRLAQVLRRFVAEVLVSIGTPPRLAAELRARMFLGRTE